MNIYEFIEEIESDGKDRSDYDITIDEVLDIVIVYDDETKKIILYKR